MKPVHIYTLSCPVTGNIRYVGKSINLTRRIDAHLNIPRKLPCSMWVQSLKKKGLKPVLEVIDTVTKNWELVEMYWISQFRTWGFKLLNLTDGGEGCHGYKQPPKHREKRRQSMLGKNKGKKLSEEHKQAIAKFQSATKKNRPWKYTIDQVIAVKKALLINDCKACIARELNVNTNFVYEISYGRYSEVEI